MITTVNYMPNAKCPFSRQGNKDGQYYEHCERYDRECYNCGLGYYG